MNAEKIKWDYESHSWSVSVPCMDDSVIVMDVFQERYDDDMDYFQVDGNVLDPTGDVMWQTCERFNTLEEAVDYLLEEIKCTFEPMSLKPRDSNWLELLVKE